MSTTLSSSPIDAYWQYLVRCSIQSDSLSSFVEGVVIEQWDEPDSALDFNNFAVLALIEAEQTEDAELRAIHLDMALEALSAGIEQHPSHPLCLAHLALVHCMTGQIDTGINLAFSAFIGTLQPAHAISQSLPLGLVYLPDTQNQTSARSLSLMLQAPNGHTQAIQVMAWVLYQFQLVFYNPMAVRFMRLALQIMPNSAELHLKLGLTHLMSQQWEGLLHLHRANTFAPNQASIIQALYLAYRNLNQLDRAAAWSQVAQKKLQSNPQAIEWQWARLDTACAFTYVPFDDGLLLAVEPRFQSIVTTVLLGQGDWFEAELEFWRNQFQEGMTVIDVGANAGVYTFSAAQKVGQRGRVLAIEPFSQCIQYLQETCRANQLDWVTVCAGAASDHSGTARLSLHSASELNEVVCEQDGDYGSAGESGQFESIDCFTLDSLIDREGLERVDWLKIDAEGHEMQVLVGSDRLLSMFHPAILYENIAGSQASNTPVAEFLQAKGYQLYRYQPYLQKLMPISSIEALQGNLNIIALPPDHPLI